MTMKIYNFGSLNMDLVYGVKDFVKSGQTIAALDLQTYPGGKGLNQSIAAARAGGCVYHVGCVGSDGDFLKEYLEKDGVNTDYLKITEGFCGHAVIQVNQKGQNCIIVYPGANHRLDKEFIDRVFKDIGNQDMVLLQNEINLVDYIMTKCGEKGVRIVFNPSPVTDDLLKYPLKLVNTFILNETEGTLLSGQTEPDLILKALALKYPDTEIVLTLGELGSIYHYKDKKVQCGIFKTTTVDTTGAGDTYCGTFLACIARGMDPEKAIVYASAAAAIAVSRKGAASSIPVFHDVEAFLESAQNIWQILKDTLES